MNDFVYNLPPANVQYDKCDRKDLQGYLELEVSLINFIISNNTDIKFNFDSGKLPESEIFSENKIVVQDTEHYDYDTPTRKGLINNRNKNKNSASAKNISHEIVSNIQGSKENEKGNYNQNNLLDSVQVKIVWCGERAEDSAILSISCKTQQAKQYTEHLEFKTKRKYNKHFERHNKKRDLTYKHQQQNKRQYIVLSADNKLRYRICTNGALFLEYLRSCKPIEITVSGASDNSSTQVLPLGQAHFSLPVVLLKKFNHNIVKGHNFKYKTKVYTLYNKPESLGKTFVKSGEIQLCFKMLFAPTAVASASAVAVTHHPKVVIHKNHYHHQHHRLGGKSTKVPEDVQGDIPRRLASQTKAEEIVEAMKKLDAKLVAYLAGENEITSKFNICEEENVVNLSLENYNTSNNLRDMSPVTKFNIFKTITGLKLEMEALTLQPEGTKCLNLQHMQHEIEPIFTVECQLSNELIKLVPRHDMFHIMQFESEKFQSLTQCVRFSQKAERAVKLDINAGWSDENANEAEHDFGRVHFTVWWRETGTCLNQMLGMGTLDLNDLYDDSLLEQCKRIEIQRRNKHLAYLYFKVTLQRDTLKQSLQMKRDLFLSKQNSMDSDEKTSATDKNKNNNVDQQQLATQCGMQLNNGANSNTLNGTDKGEYAEKFFYLKQTEIQ